MAFRNWGADFWFKVLVLFLIFSYATFIGLSAQEFVENVQNILNNRPRKRLGFKSPNEFFAQKLNQEGAVAFIT